MASGMREISMPYLVDDECGATSAKAYLVYAHRSGMWNVAGMGNMAL